MTAAGSASASLIPVPMLAEGESTRLARLPGIFLAALAAEARARHAFHCRGSEKAAGVKSITRELEPTTATRVALGASPGQLGG